MHLTGWHAHLGSVSITSYWSWPYGGRKEWKIQEEAYNVDVHQYNHSMILRKCTKIAAEKSAVILCMYESKVINVGKPCTCSWANIKSAIVLSSWAVSKRDVAGMGIYSKELLPVKYLPMGLRQRGGRSISTGSIVWSGISPPYIISLLLPLLPWVSSPVILFLHPPSQLNAIQC